MHNGLLIGCGFFAGNHMNGWAAAEGARITAVCDLDRTKAQAMADKFGITQVFTDVEEALATVKPDFVDVCTTVDSHRPLVELALASGALTICQKPFANTLKDARAMCDAADAAGKPLIIHENFRWQHPKIELKKLLDQNIIGDPTFARLSFRHGWDVYAGQPYLAETEKFAIMDVGLHLFDLDRFLLGDVADIHCRTQSLKPGIAGEDAFTATVKHDNGTVCVIDCSFFTKVTPDPFPETLIRIEGMEGTLELLQNYEIRVHKNGEVKSIPAEPEKPDWAERPWHVVQDSVAAFEAHVVDVLNGKAEPQPSGRHNLTTLAMAVAAYESNDTGRTIRIADIEMDLNR